MPVFQSVPRGICGQRAMPRAVGFTACHTSTYGWPVTSTWSRTGRAGLVDDAGLLAAGHEVVDEHADPPARAGTEVAHVRHEVVDAAERLDDDALDAQVVAPDALDQRGVVHALDPDAAGPRGPGRGRRDGVGARRGAPPGRRARPRPAPGARG